MIDFPEWKGGKVFRLSSKSMAQYDGCWQSDEKRFNAEAVVKLKVSFLS